MDVRAQLPFWLSFLLRQFIHRGHSKTQNGVSKDAYDKRKPFTHVKLPKAFYKKIALFTAMHRSWSFDIFPKAD